MINIKNLKKSYNNLEILKGIDLNIEKGSIFGIIGRSGAGKSTLLRCLNGLEKYDSGLLEVDGTDIRTLNEKELRLFRKDIGMIFQQFSLITRDTVYDNIAFPMRCWKFTKKQIDERVKYLINVVGISDKIYSLARELSGGQKQRVAIARALSMNPKILLSDEATSALDPKNSEAIIELLNDINKSMGITIVLVTHQMDILKSICDDMAIIENGIIEDSGKVEDMFLYNPNSLLNLLGNQNILLPDTGINLEIKYKSKEKNNFIEELIKEFNVSIVNMKIDNYKNNTIYDAIINVEEDNLNNIYRYLKISGIEYYKIIER